MPVRSRASLVILAVAAVLGLAALLAGRGDIGAAPAGDPAIGYDSADPEMNAAIAAARATLDGFLARLDDPAFRPDSVALKVAIPTPEGGHEHIYIVGIERLRQDRFAGTIDNEPDNLPGIGLGDRYEFGRDLISDWLYWQDGRIHGAHTLRVMLPRMPAEEAHALGGLLAPLPEAPGQ